MNILSHLRKSSPYSQMLWGMLLLLIVCFPAQVMAQITIGGNVYGGGDMGNVGGNTRVHMLSGVLGTDDPDNPGGSVFGGARMADIAGNTVVHIDGAYTDNEGNPIAATDYMVINRVYGGNDISGHIGTDKEAAGAQVPTDIITSDKVDATWDAFVHISNQKKETLPDEGDPNPTDYEDTKKIYIGQLFGGGNGEYQYTSQTDQQNVTTHIIRDHNGNTVATTTNDVNYPDIGKTLVDIHGGSIVYAYGGGNMATVTGQTIICIDNPSKVVNMIKVDANGLQDDNGTNILSDNRFKAMGINTGYSKPGSEEYQIGRLFGGNNLAEMAIRPTWHLETGKIRNVYSGGNKGAMTNLQGLLLDIDPDDNDKDKLFIDYVYGGGRMADVRPLSSGTIAGEDAVDAEPYQIQLGNDVTDKNGVGYNFPGGLSSRVLVKGGHINNVYGGNDVTGHVYGGSAVGIYTTVYGDVYGGGNGSYPYTDNPVMENDDIYGDFYYGDYYNKTKEGKTSVQALNDFRPDAEQISLYLKGTENNPTIVKGSVYLGGNSATMRTTKDDPMVELKLGSYVIADNVFMGNNGENMVTANEVETDPNNNGTVTKLEGVLRVMNREVDSQNNTLFSSINVKDPGVFKTYMEGAAMSLNPSSDKRIVFDDGYVPYSAQIGSLYCGGNVGSMTYSGTQIMDFSAPIIIYNKLVGGCNNADVPYRADYNAAYEGGILGSNSEQDSYTDGNGNIKDRLVMNFDGLRIVPKRWDDTGLNLVYNTVGEDADRRLIGGNIYGGCYNSGHVNGNVVINIDGDIIDRYGENGLFADTKINDKGEEVIDESGNSRTGVILNQQAYDVNIIALTVFGAGYGKRTEIWGSTAVNLNNGYAMQIFGGGEEGYVGKGVIKDGNERYDEDGYYAKDYSKYNRTSAGGLEDNAQGKLAYSSTVTLNGTTAVYNEDDNPQGLAEAEYLYGAGNEGDVCGNSYVYLGNGRIYDAFGGASDATIYGHTEVYIGRRNKDDNGIDNPPFPYIRDIVYGGNDFGGSILGQGDMHSRVRDNATLAMVHSTDANNDGIKDVLQTATYVEYLQGKVDTIFGGSYGFYDYGDIETYGYADEDAQTIRTMPYQHNSFVNIRPNNNNNNNYINSIFGGGTGRPGYRDSGDAAQDRSYVLIDIPDDHKNYIYTQVFGAGSYNGLGMGHSYAETTAPNYNSDNVSAIVDLLSGQVGVAYGGSYMEGVTRRTLVNVPNGSRIQIGSIYGGSYGTNTLAPCDVYESNVNYRSSNALLVYNPEMGSVYNGTIYGGNNNERRTLYSRVNIGSRVRMSHPRYGTTTGYVYGAGHGANTWTEYTLVNLEANANVYEVYGGGEEGKVHNAQSIQKYKDANKPQDLSDAAWAAAWKLGGDGYDPAENENYYDNTATNLSNPLTREAEIDDRTDKTYKYNTNVIINENAWVGNYAYGGGKGEGAVVAGTTYIALLGGGVNKDLYAAGTSGAVQDLHRAGNFTASATAYIQGGIVRNVYGGGWRGSVGYAHYKQGSEIYHKNDTIVYEQIPDFFDTNNNCTDILGESHVVIGKIDGTSYTDGIPSITRNVYGGGEGGAIFGTAYTTIYNGYIGYRYKNGEYAEENDDAAVGDNLLAKHGGNVFGGGYVANSYVDETSIKMFGGTIRGSMFGGGEIAPVGRGTVRADYSGSTYPSNRIINGDARIYKAGRTNIQLYSGNVGKSVFGGGRGYDNWKGDGWMDKLEQKTMDLSSKGYVFGNTEVYIYGGRIGTDKNILMGDGNVFGGGDEGLVYSATGTKNSTDGYYYDSDDKLTEDCKVIVSPYAQIKPIHILTDISDSENTLFKNGDYITIQQFQDLPAAVKSSLVQNTNWEYDNNAVTVGTETYLPITSASNPSLAYVPTNKLNLLTKNNLDGLTRLDNTGIEIGNAVFAGGNISVGSDNIYVNATTVFGNATASVTDVFVKDLITIGEDGIGGLYGDGNMTFVDGYRELNITNYGTDYYNLSQSLTIDEYKKLNDRERAYFELLYQAKETHSLTYYESKGTHPYNNITYKRGQKILAETYNGFTEDEKKNWNLISNKSYAATARITEDEFDLFWEEEKQNWELYGFCTLYAGRMINTIQRADFCGVFGSRVVMRGAQDRVPKTVDYTEYTINRVKEVSLNIVNDPNNPNDKAQQHGNYFGIYNVVNYLGALTSDVKLDSPRTTESSDVNNTADGTTTYYNWKQANLTNRRRNNASSPNEVALASGVWLEILDESTETAKKKVYGPITGVVELTLLNVAPGEGGGYVYAKNIHGTQYYDDTNITTLAAANLGAHSYKQYSYTPDEVTASEANGHQMQSSGNFVNSLKRIVDDCYPNGGAYYTRTGGEAAAPAHYWYIRGDYYVYDQYLSAYTGSAQAYAENVTIPLTITAESHGKITLNDVKPNRYAYFNIENIDPSYKSQTDPTAIMVGGKTYKLNDPITYWDWSHLGTTEQNFFELETWVCTNDATYNEHEYKKGDVFNTKPTTLYVCKEAFMQGEVQYEKGHVFTASEYAALTGDNPSKCALVFNETNSINHDNGFLLTFDWDNPDVWNDYYHQETGDAIQRSSQSNNIPDGYITSPSFKFKGNGTHVLGQLDYSVGDIIDYNTYSYQTDNISGKGYVDESTQARFDLEYIAVTNHNFTTQDGVQYVPYASIPSARYDTLKPADKEKFDQAILCTTTYEYLNDKGETEYVVAGTTLPLGKDDGSEPGTYNYYLHNYDNNVENYFCNSYICTQSGKWGGSLFTNGTNYRAVSYSNLNNSERTGKFDYNYDAFDLLVDPAYSGVTGNYDKPNTANPIYSVPQSIDYEATYTGTETLNVGKDISVRYYDNTTQEFKTTTKSSLTNGDIISNVDYESLVNEAANYSAIVVTPTHKTDTTYYVVNTGFQVGDKWYSEGSQMSYEVWDGLSADRDKVTPITFQQLTGGTTAVTENKIYYFCTNQYTAKTEIQTINNDSYQASATVPVGTLIDSEVYDELENDQIHFTINGKTPTETSTIYVSRDVDINSLSQDKIITVVYYYDYMERDETGSAYEKIREKHVVNVHVHFESGMPQVGELMTPNTVLPGNLVTLNQPTVTKGAYDILGGGWELYTSQASADSHRNGIPFKAGTTPLYWYQDGYMIAYYAMSYLGKSYSNAVPLSVANYHRMDDIIDINTDDENNLVEVTTDNNYMYLNQAVKDDKRNPKIYVGSDLELNKLALFYKETVTDQEDLLNEVKDCDNLEFILDSDIRHTGTWESIGGEQDCFSGTLHGDGYTISALDHALFDNLCGDVYNLGVTGTFTDAGIANSGEGYIENSWISSTATGAKQMQPIFGNPNRTDNQVQVVNSYYLENYDDAYLTDGDNVTPKEGSYTKQIADNNNSDHGTPIRKDAQAFYNGEVAFNLNGFYLNKRYYDGTNNSGEVSYYYIDPTMEYDPNQDEPKQLKTGHYPAQSSRDAKLGDIGYVEERYADGDFRYAGGTIPSWTDDRERTLIYTENNVETEEIIYAPIWPNDYLFFGQRLTFGYVDGTAHQETPSHYSSSNRVYRAPAYYGDSKMDVAYFNPDAVLAHKEKLTDSQVAANATARDAFPGMTAIDFTGYNDVTGSASDFKQGETAATATAPAKFYAPLLDFGGLTGFRNDGQTKNMLVYADYEDDGKADVETTVEKTLSVLNNYLVEPEYRRHANNVVSNGQGGENATPIDDYGSVKQVSNIAVNNVHGHLVLKKANDYVAATDHFLVDKNELNEPFDFNAPIEYTMGKRDNNEPNIMWYQRTPDVFVQNAGTGWESISLPFTATTVTTNQKGVITHFYQGNNNDKGHEYWLRTPDRIDETNNNIKVLFKSPASGTGSVNNTTFLWDYYYSKNHQETGKPGRDANDDIYQDDYYKTQTTFSNYPYATAAEPYLIGFPSERYYEFDLSGNFVAQNTAVTGPVKLNKQTVTFVSATDGTVRINVSDQDYENMTSIAGNSGTFNFKPIYQARQLDTESTYLLNDQAITVTDAQSGNVTYNAGTAFLKDGVAGSATVPFRAYISSNNTAGRVQTRGANLTNALYIGYAGNNDQLEDRASLGGLIIYSQDMNICVESTLDYETQVTIYTVAGKLLKRFNIKPATKVTVPVNNRGVYIVNRKKIAVTR